MSHIVTNATFGKKVVAIFFKKLDESCNKLWLCFVIKQLQYLVTSVPFCKKMSEWTKYDTATTVLLQCLHFLVSSTMLVLFPLYLIPSSLDGCCVSVALQERKQEQRGSFAWSLGSVNESFLETFWFSQV